MLLEIRLSKSYKTYFLNEKSRGGYPTKTIKYFINSKLNINFAAFPTPKTLLDKVDREGNGHIKEKTFIWRFVQATQNFAVLYKFCLNKATIDVRGVCYFLLTTFLSSREEREVC